MVRLHHGIPHGITMVRPRGNTAWPSMVNHGRPLYTIVRQRGNITGRPTFWPRHRPRPVGFGLGLASISFLADRTNGRAYATVLRLSSVVCL